LRVSIGGTNQQVALHGAVQGLTVSTSTDVPPAAERRQGTNFCRLRVNGAAGVTPTRQFPHGAALTRSLATELGHDRVAAPATISPLADNLVKQNCPPDGCHAPLGTTRRSPSGPSLLGSDALLMGQKVNTQFTTKRSNGCNAMQAGLLRGRHDGVEQSTWFNSRARIGHWLPFRFRRERRHREQHCVRSSCGVGRTGSGFRPGRTPGDTSRFR
jgi:hypothetical protein